MATTTEQGYGWEHQQIAARLHHDHVDGTLCDRCWQPMDKRLGHILEAAHPHDRPRALYPDSKADHLEHRRCNRAGLLLPRPGLKNTREW